MPGKNNKLFSMLASLVLLLVMVTVLMTVPSFRGIGQGISENAMSRLENLDNTQVDVTSVPFALPDYMWDAEISDNVQVNLRPLISSVATHIPDVLNETGLRIHVGKDSRACALTIAWDTGITETLLTVTLLDRLERPLEFSCNATGTLKAIVPGGLYKLIISSNGKLGDNFLLSARTDPTSEQPDFTNSGTEGIPTIQIQMTEAIYQSWDTQRAAIYKEIGETLKWVDTSNFKKIRAEIFTDGIPRTVQLWEAGSGDPVHFSPDAPSFTGSIIAGPLLYGMSQFKLYSIRAQEGLMNYVVESIMYDEGILIPRFMLVNTTLNDKALGLYLLVETPNSDGFFSGVLRYPGMINDWQGSLPVDPTHAAGLLEQEPLSAVSMNDPAFADIVNTGVVAKTLALTSRFLATHSLSESDLRWYYDPYLGSPEPVLRDLNAGMMSEEQVGERSLLIHAGWWLGPGLSGPGPNYNPKVFPMDAPYNPYIETPTSLNIGSVDTKPYHFVRNARNREIFDQYLFYVSDNAFQQKLTARIQSAYEAAVPFLDDGSKRPLPEHSETYIEGITNEADWLKWQVEQGPFNQKMIPRDLSRMVQKSVLLVSTLQTPNMGNNLTISLYNLSPFSARLRLPNYARISGDNGGEITNYAENGWYLAPSLLFPTVISVSDEALKDVNSLFPFTKEATEKFLTLEWLRLKDPPNSTVSFKPFVNIEIPASHLNEMMALLEKESIVTLASLYPLSSDKNIVVSRLPEEKLNQFPTVPSSQEPSPEIVILPLSFESVDSSTTRLSLLVTNFSQENISLDMSSLRWTDADNLDLELPTSLHAMWKLGEMPSLANSSRIDLGSAGYRVDSSQSLLDSPMLWTGGLKGLLEGAKKSMLPNAVLVEYDFQIEDINTCWTQTDANALARSAVSSLSNISIVVQEPFRVYLPMQSLKELSIPGYQSPRASTKISVSSYFNNHAKENLIDGDPNTLWHVNFPPKTTEHWVSFDFGKAITIEGIAVLPHIKLVDQIWDQDHAVFQGSNDPTGTGWVDLARLFIDKKSLLFLEWDWISFTIPNTTAYRHYRIFINDPTFLSIAEVKFRAKEWQSTKHATLLTVSELLAQGILEEKTNTNSQKMLHFKDKDALISELIRIPAGYTLEIDPGSTIKFAKGAGILSYSPIKAIGTTEEPITFTPSVTTDGWLGIAVVGTDGTSELQRVIMTGATGGSMGDVQFSGGLTFMKSAVTLKDVELVDFSAEDGLHLSNAYYEVDNLTISNSYSDGLDSDWSNGIITGSLFINNGGDGVDLSGSYSTITGCTMEANTDKGISIGEGAVAYINDVRLIDNRTGIAVKDQSAVKLSDSEITRNHYGLLRYIKKPVFSYPELVVSNNSIHGNVEDIYEESPNLWTRQFDQ